MKGCAAMDHTWDPFESSSSNKDEKVEPGELLEESWFFGNSLDRRTKFLRCLSDPCPSSKYSKRMLVSNSYTQNSSKNKLKLSKGNGFACPSLVRTPSLPPTCMPQRSLVRAPSLPPCIGREDVSEDTESDFALSKLIRQASLNTSDFLPPRHHSSKAMALDLDGAEDKVRRPHLLVQSSAPPIPNWVDQRSPKDMKTQIKFWARTVASNVRQEC